jgi:Ca-activated chloride channel family protein
MNKPIIPLFLLTVFCSLSVACRKGGGDKGGDTGAWGASDDYVNEVDDEDPADTDEEDTAEDDCDEQTPITFWISPDDSNSMSAAAMARDAVLAGRSTINNVSLRTWEFMNYYRFDYQRPEPGSLGIHAALTPDPSGEAGAYIMNIGVASPGLDKAERDPMNLVFSLDTSGSMGGSPISLLRASCTTIAGELMAGDVVSMVTWNSDQQTVLESHAVSGPDDSTLLGAISRLTDGGSTDLHRGLTTAYQLAEDNYAPGRINRVILISDGGANVGVTDENLIANHSEREDGEGIYMMGVGVGTAQSYNDVLMDTVTDAGKGAAVFIGSTGEADSIFGDRFLEVLDVAARDVAVRLDLPPGFAITRFSGEEYSSDPQEVEPQHLAPNDAMVFQQHIATCAPELLEADPEVTIEVSWKDAVTFEAHSTRRTMPWSELLGSDQALLWKGEAVFSYVLALKAYKSHGATSTELGAATTTWQHAQERAEALNPGDEDLVEIRAVMTRLVP